MLETDASNVGLGAVLYHIQKSKKRVIAFASRALKISERNTANYSSNKLEYLAIVCAVTVGFSHYLMGEKCLVITDNSAITFLHRKKGIIRTGTTLGI